MDIYQFIFWDQLELIKRLQYVEIKSLLLILRKQKGDSHGYRYYKNFLKGERKEITNISRSLEVCATELKRVHRLGKGLCLKFQDN